MQAATDSPADIECVAPPIGRFADSIERICLQLQANGALGIAMIDATALEGIERSFGREAHRVVSERLSNAVVEACASYLTDADQIVAGAVGQDEIFVFFFRDRSDDVFYRESLESVARHIHHKLAELGNRIVYPYKRSVPAFPVGSAFAIYNPGLSEERQIREAQCIPDLIQTEEVADVALFLASDVSRAMTGQQFVVDRGWVHE